MFFSWDLCFETVSISALNTTSNYDSMSYSDVAFIFYDNWSYLVQNCRILGSLKQDVLSIFWYLLRLLNTTEVFVFGYRTYLLRMCSRIFFDSFVFGKPCSGRFSIVFTTWIYNFFSSIMRSYSYYTTGKYVYVSYSWIKYDYKIRHI